MREACEVAEILEEIYEKKFFGKKYGRFKISRTSFKEICRRKQLRESFINDVIDEGLELGLVIIPLEHIIVVVKEDALTNCRLVPEDIVAKYYEEDDDDWEDEDIFDEEEIEDDDESEDD